jgi:hypothetical protein
MGKHQTGPDRLVVNNDRARATNAVFAANVRARQTTIFTQRIDQGLAVLNVNSVNLAIDRQLEGVRVIGHLDRTQ